MSQQVVGPLDGMEGLCGEGSHHVGSSEGVERVRKVRRAESKSNCVGSSLLYMGSSPSDTRSSLPVHIQPTIIVLV